MMLRAMGRFEGEIQEFELWDPKRTNRLAGFYFSVTCEWIDGQWLSFCEKCHNFRCLKIDILKQTWECLKCDRSGPFKKPEPEKKKKTKIKELPAESEKKGMSKEKKKEEKKPVIDYKKMERLAKQYHQKLSQGIREVLREERGLSDKVIDKYQIGYCEQHPEYKSHKKSITIPIYKDKKIINIRYHSLDPKRKKEAPKILPYTANLPDATLE